MGVSGVVPWITASRYMLTLDFRRLHAEQALSIRVLFCLPAVARVPLVDMVEPALSVLPLRPDGGDRAASKVLSERTAPDPAIGFM